MTKELVTIEFRYMDVPKNEHFSGSESKKITIGVYDTFDEAAAEGNKVLEILESKFKLHIFPKGNTAPKKRFSKNGGCFGSREDLISDLAYLKTPFNFFIKIITLKYDDVEQSINEIVEAGKKYRKFKWKQEY